MNINPWRLHLKRTVDKRKIPTQNYDPKQPKKNTKANAIFFWGGSVGLQNDALGALGVNLRGLCGRIIIIIMLIIAIIITIITAITNNSSKHD